MNFYRKSIKSYSHIVYSLTDLLKGSNSDNIRTLVAKVTQCGSKGDIGLRLGLANLQDQSRASKVRRGLSTSQHSDSKGSKVPECQLTDTPGSTEKLKSSTPKKIPETSYYAKVAHSQWQWSTVCEKAFT